MCPAPEHRWLLLIGRIAASLAVFGAAFTTRTFYVDDLLAQIRRGRPAADFKTAITEVTQKYTFVYEARAKGILAGRGVLFTDEPAHRLLGILHPPGYPIFIAGVYRLAPPKLRSIARAQLLLDSACAALVTFAASGVFGLAAGAASGGLIALSPHLAYNAMVPMPDTASAWPIVAGVLALLLAWGRRRPTAGFALASLGVGLSCWLRANAMLLPLGLALLAWRSAASSALVSVLVAAVVIAPITLRNALQYRVFVPVGWGSGGTLVEGIADYDFENRFGFPKFDHDLGKWDDESVRTHLDRERLLTRKGLELIVEHPVWFAGVMLRRALFQWSYDTRSERALDTPFHTRIQPVVSDGPGLRGWVHLAQSGYGTLAGRSLTLLGVFWLARAGRRRELAALLLVPAYFLVFQSVLHTEYRYSLVIHYFLFVVMAVGACESLRAVWRFGPGRRPGARDAEERPRAAADP